MSHQFNAQSVLDGVVSSDPRVPGVVAMVTDRERNIFEGAAGVRRLDQDAAMTTDSAFAIFSTTKAITATAALQLVEEGKLDLDAPASTYAPDIGKLKVIEGFDAAGEPILREPKRPVTTKHLLLHTGGFGYDFFSETYNRLAQEKGQPSVITASKASLMTPLQFDPGDRWEYGTNIDWCGQVVEGITGKRQGEVFQTRIFEPLGIEDMTFELNDGLRARLAGMHARGADGSLTPMDFELPDTPEIHMGGHGLYGTVGDYMRFIRMWPNDGMGENGRVLKPETVAELERQATELARALNVIGLMNIQFAIQNDDIYILEVNPRASRTVPFVAKVIGKPIAGIASEVMAGKPISAFGLTPAHLDHIAVKEAVFPFARFPGVDPVLGPEMRSTGEVMGIDRDYAVAFAKSQLGGGAKLPLSGTVFVSVKDLDKDKVLAPVRTMVDMGFRIVATRGTQRHLSAHGIPCERVNKVLEGRPHIVDAITNGEIDVLFNTTEGAKALADSMSIRRSALLNHIPYYTTLAGALAVTEAIKALREGSLTVAPLQSYVGTGK